MIIELKNPYLSIKELNQINLPNFAVLIGPNGVGKTQLLDAMANGHAVVRDVPLSEIEKYDIDTFKPGNLSQIAWGNCIFAEHTCEQFLSKNNGDSLIFAAAKIFADTLNEFGIDSTSQNRYQVEDDLRNHIGSLPDFTYFFPINNSNVLSKYSEKILELIINPLKLDSSRSKRSQNKEKTSCNNDPALLLSLAMKLTRKLPHELSRDDILRAAYYEGHTIANQLSYIFTRYKVEQYSWAHTQGERGNKSVHDLMAEYRQTIRPPWELLRDFLENMRKTSNSSELFNFEFSDPEEDQISFAAHQQYTFSAKFTNRSTGDSYSMATLSSGEKILMSLCLASFNKTMGRRQPKLILLDELDSVLHPSMVSALIAGLKEHFVNHGTSVIMATHSVTTVSLLEEGEIFKISRKGGVVDVNPVDKDEAITDLSEGLATIDAGLRIVVSNEMSPITILTEGYNFLHLKKWVDLFYPGKIYVFDKLPNQTGKDQLTTYGRFLSRVDANTHFLIVLDCDAEGKVKKLCQDLPVNGSVTAFSFKKRTNQITEKGIENMYDEEILKPFSIRKTDPTTHEEIGFTFLNSNKKDFGEHVLSRGTKNYFNHFNELSSCVEGILKTL